jgi:hypothetical protein
MDKTRASVPPFALEVGTPLTWQQARCILNQRIARLTSDCRGSHTEGSGLGRLRSISSLNANGSDG